jgi:FkbM family methyltransferase
MDSRFKRLVYDFSFARTPRLAKLLFKHHRFLFNKEKLLNILPTEPIILEIGAHVGTDTVEFRDLFPKAIIHSFEPLPSNFRRLVNRTKGRDIHCHQLALGTINGKSKFFVSSREGSGSSSLRRPTGHLKIWPKIKFKEEIEVDVRRLEDWLLENSIEKVDFLWMDSQSTELEILKNSGNILQSVRAIHLEVSLIELYENSPLYSEVKQYLEENGFFVSAEFFDEASEVGIMGKDVLFLKRDINFQF